MTNDRTTINVSKDAHRTAKAAKRDGESWTEYLLRCTDEAPANGVDAEAIAEHLEATLDRAKRIEDPDSGNEGVAELHGEIRKAQELAEQARDAAQRVEEGMH